jgi:hypothetical protein
VKRRVPDRLSQQRVFALKDFGGSAGRHLFQRIQQDVRRQGKLVVPNGG